MERILRRVSLVFDMFYIRFHPTYFFPSVFFLNLKLNRFLSSPSCKPLVRKLVPRVKPHFHGVPKELMSAQTLTNRKTAIKK